QIRANEERMKIVFSAVPSGIVLISKNDLKIRYTNQYAIDLIGRPNKNLIGSHCRKYICVDREDHCPLSDEGAVGIEYECDLRGVNGTLPIMKKVVPVTINKQEFLLESFIDISDRKVMENSLRAEKDITKKFMDTAGVIMLVLNNKGDVIFINQKGCEVLDMSEEELVGKNWVEEFLTDVDIDEGKAIFEELKNDGSDIFNYSEIKYITRSGQEKTLAWHHSVLMNDEGMVTHIISSGEDITLRKANEKALKTSEEKYRLIFDTAASMIISIDMNGTIVDCNKKLKNTLGYGRSELSGENITRLVHPDDISMAMESINEVFSHGTSMNKECRMVTKSGNIIDVSVNSSGIKEDGDEYSRMICMMEDITEKKKAENELLEKTRELERFANISIGRENKMIELKARVQHLEGQVSGLIEISLG
ncbi:MAG: PAS domain S-box protein, partial [Thermoplasmata archaeon]|nr:PAS domain S-box protein [Thermoplasmata archaeon]